MNYQEEYIQRVIEEFKEKEKEVVYATLQEKGIVIDWEKEQSCRFKSLVIETKDLITTYYYNDGSDNGLRIVTFEVVTNHDNGFKVELKYY